MLVENGAPPSQTASMGPLPFQKSNLQLSSPPYLLSLNPRLTSWLIRKPRYLKKVKAIKDKYIRDKAETCTKLIDAGDTIPHTAPHSVPLRTRHNTQRRPCPQLPPAYHQRRVLRLHARRLQPQPGALNCSPPALPPNSVCAPPSPPPPPQLQNVPHVPTPSSPAHTSPTPTPLSVEEVP